MTKEEFKRALEINEELDMYYPIMRVINADKHGVSVSTINVGIDSEDMPEEDANRLKRAVASTIRDIVTEKERELNAILEGRGGNDE